MFLPDSAQIILREMLIHSRVKLTNKKLSNTISTQNSPILSSNPEIQVLVDKLLIMSESLPQESSTTLNLIKWQKQKYRPNQIQNRVRIENQISLIKVCNQKVRSRIKPIKRALSVEISEISGKPYKEHYEEIKESFNRKNSCSYSSYDSEEQYENPSTSVFNSFSNDSKQSKGGIKYYQNLKKYDRIVQFIHNRLDLRSQQKQRKLTSFYSQTLPTSPHSTQQNKLSFKKHFSTTEKDSFANFRDKQSNIRVSSIVKKWKPMSKMDRIFSRSGKRERVVSKKLAWNEQRLPVTAQPSMKKQQSSLLDNYEEEAKSRTSFEY